MSENVLFYEDSIIKIKGRDRHEDIHNFLFIKNSPCDKNILGLKLFENIKIREYNIEANEFNLYLEKAIIL